MLAGTWACGFVKPRDPSAADIQFSQYGQNVIADDIWDIISCRCDYILTSGQKQSVDQGVENLKQLIKLANNRIEILAGGGVNSMNIKKLYNIGIREFHLSGVKKNKFDIQETDFYNIYNAVNKLIKIEN